MILQKGTRAMHCPRFVIALVLLLPLSARAAEPALHARIDSNVAHYVVNRDQTYTLTESMDATLLSRRALQALDRAVFTFYPDKQTLELVEAWVTQPDGSRVTVPPGSIFTRPTAAAQSAPGFTNSQTTTVLFPQLQPGSRTHAVWKLTQTMPTMFGFDARNINTFDWDTGVDETRIDLPADLPLVWKARGGFAVTDETAQGTRHIVAQIRDLGIRNILALRGDPPGGVGEFAPTPKGFSFARDLVSFARCFGEFSIGVAGFPEGHVACREGKHADWQHLKEKVEAGADFIITQIFFDNADFHRFREHLVTQLGVRVPIIPGILPILTANQVKKFTQLCGATMPAAFLAKLDELGDDDVSVTQFGIEYATRQCEDLIRAGVPGLHFYTLNKAFSTLHVLDNLGLIRA